MVRQVSPAQEGDFWAVVALEEKLLSPQVDALAGVLPVDVLVSDGNVDPLYEFSRVPLAPRQAHDVLVSVPH